MGFIPRNLLLNEGMTVDNVSGLDTYMLTRYAAVFLMHCGWKVVISVGFPHGIDKPVCLCVFICFGVWL